MIAKYNGEYYLTASKAPKLRIWRYTPVEGFKETRYESGARVFKKEVMLIDLEEMFEAEFSVMGRGHEYPATLTNHGEAVALVIDMDNCSYEHEFNIHYEKLTDEYFTVVSLNSCREFYLTKTLVYPEEKVEKIELTKEDWLEQYQMLVIDVAKWED